jgi:hypothetical protein
VARAAIRPQRAVEWTKVPALEERRSEYTYPAVMQTSDGHMRALNLAILAVAIACSDASTSPGSQQLTGTYTLQSIGGDRLPYESMAVWSCLPGPLGCAGPHTIRSMVITVNADGTWSSAYDWSRWTILNGEEAYMSTPDGWMTGVWTRWGMDVVFRTNSLNDDFFIGAVDGSTMTLDWNFVLTRTSPR